MADAVGVMVPVRKRRDVRPNKKPPQNGRRRPNTPKEKPPEEKKEEEVDDGQPYVIATSRLIDELPCTRCLHTVFLFVLDEECLGAACPKGSLKGRWVFVPLAYTKRCNGKQAPR